MKILNIENGKPTIYIQIKNLKAIAKYERNIPRSLIKIIEHINLEEYDENNENFIHITNKKIVQYLANLEWIPNYRNICNLTNKQLQAEIDDEMKELYEIYHITQACQDQQSFFNYRKEYSKKNQTIKDLKTYLWTIQGIYDTPIELPLGIDTEQPYANIQELGCTIGLSFDKSKILLTKTNKKPFTPQDSYPTTLLQSSIVSFGIEAGLFNMDESYCCFKSYRDKTGKYFITEYTTIPYDAKEKPKEPTRIKSPKTKVKTIFDSPTNKKNAE